MGFCISSALSLICLFTISITSLFGLVSGLCVCLHSSISDNQGSDKICISLCSLMMNVGELSRKVAHSMKFACTKVIWTPPSPPRCFYPSPAIPCSAIHTFPNSIFRALLRAVVAYWIGLEEVKTLCCLC